jgi:biopolymer transport protein ExbB
MLGLVFFNGLNTKVRMIVHQLEVIKLMLLNRRFGSSAPANVRPQLKAV